MAKKQKKEKEPKRKPKYGTFSCVAYIYRLLWKHERGLAFTGIFTVPISLLLSALALYTPSLILSALETSDRFSTVALVILGLLLAKLLLNLAHNITESKISTSEHYVLLRMVYMLKEHMQSRDFYLDYNPEVEKLDQRANSATEHNHTAGVHFPMDFSNMVSQILNFLLFSSVVSLLHPVVILLLAVGAFLNFLMSRWERGKNWQDRDGWNDLGKKITYSTFQLSRDFKYAKDIRLYSMKQPMHDRLQGLLEQDLQARKKRMARNILTAMENFFMVLLRDGAAYAFLIYRAVQGEVDASSFVLYFSAITSLSGLMNGILEIVNRVSEGAMQISDFRESLEEKGRLNHGAGIPVPQGPFTIEFQNVSYQYPKGEKKILDHVSFKIEAGEKIAIVGLNGAGKTTLTMLMCGLLLPDEGEVLLDGHSLYEYNRDEMYALFGLVPQRYNLLPISIARNIASALTEDEIDYERLAYCIEVAGLTEKIASLPNGVETPLNRQIHKDGIELSGGEAQKLLLARLLYKNPPCIILDEPTAALDPIAEDRMYRRYNEIVANATSIFISHRLASTQFCNRIFLLDGATFAEVGTHAELMAAGGKYRQLFDVQSKYYREGENTHEA